MPELKCTLSTHHTIFQVSTATALVEGIYQGAVRIGDLREHGDLGLGTFEDLDGEMVIVDGRFFQVRCDGSVREIDETVLSPFAVITRFAPGPAVTVNECPDMGHLTNRFDTLRHTDNLFFALRVDGQFDYVHARAMCRTQEGVPLVQAAAVQPEFEFHDIKGTLVGFGPPTTRERSTCRAIICTSYRMIELVAATFFNAVDRTCAFRSNGRVTTISRCRKPRIS
jgi:acetolactate decarboxylase